mmetsp:Transcript_33753/g.96523  ORF Transcript_33753/g.96523 Transcript_33753/m.96523 type:complete len:209 (-) Transcript_33753:66-692(-)
MTMSSKIDAAEGQCPVKDSTKRTSATAAAQATPVSVQTSRCWRRQSKVGRNLKTMGSSVHAAMNPAPFANLLPTCTSGNAMQSTRRVRKQKCMSRTFTLNLEKRPTGSAQETILHSRIASGSIDTRIFARKLRMEWRPVSSSVMCCQQTRPAQTLSSAQGRRTLSVPCSNPWTLQSDFGPERVCTAWYAWNSMASAGSEGAPAEQAVR